MVALPRSIFALLLVTCTFDTFAACVSDNQTLCLLADRFSVTVEWSNQAGNPKTLDDSAATGTGAPLRINSNTGTFSLLGQPHHELMIKVLDGCAVNDRFWVFAAAATNVEYTITVSDTATNQTNSYFNPQGNPAAATTDTAAFDTCPATGGATTTDPLPDISAPSPPVGVCVADGATLCLHANRFAVTIDWEDFNNSTGSGIPVPLSDESGYFHFFGPSNPELILNMYDGRPRNGNWWTFFAATTNVAYTLRVEDTVTGSVRTWTNSLGVSPGAVLDTGPTAPVATNVPVLGHIGLLLLAGLLSILGITGQFRKSHRLH